MDMDVNNQQALTAGAYYQRGMMQQQDWRPITTAPHDGTIVEIRCTYGVAPWFGIYRWTDTRKMQDQNGEMREYKTTPGWVKVGDDHSGFTEDSSFTWRPYGGAVTTYVDPTGGLQDSPAYWRGAVAAKYGLPLNHFEREVEHNVSESRKPKRSWWNWFFD